MPKKSITIPLTVEVELCAEDRAIVKSHAAKVSDIPEDELPEVWAQLCALEG